MFHPIRDTLADSRPSFVASRTNHRFADPVFSGELEVVFDAYASANTFIIAIFRNMRTLLKSTATANTRFAVFNHNYCDSQFEPLKTETSEMDRNLSITTHKRDFLTR